MKNWFKSVVGRYRDPDQAAYELKTAALRLGLNVASAVGSAYDNGKTPWAIAEWLDEGQYERVFDAAYPDQD